MDTMKKILTISVLVGLLALANSASAQLALELTPVPGAPTGYRTYDIMGTTTTNLGVMEMVLDASAAASIYQIGSPSPIEASGGTYDTYLGMGPLTWQVPSPNGWAMDIPGAAAAEAWDGQNLNKMWGPQAGELSGPGTFQVGRITLADTATAPYTIMGWEGGQGAAGTSLTGTLGTGPIRLAMVEGTGSGIGGYDRYLDFYADINTDLGVMELLLNTDTAGDIYQNSSIADNPDNADAFDSYVSTGFPTDGEQSANTQVAASSGAVDIVGGSTTTPSFDTQNIDLMWAPTGGTVTGSGLFHVGRVTLANSATGSWTLMGFQGGESTASISGVIDALALPLAGDANLDDVVNQLDINKVLANWLATGANWADNGDVTGDTVVNQLDINEVLGNWLAVAEPPSEAIPEPATLGLLVLAGLTVLRRRQS